MPQRDPLMRALSSFTRELAAGSTINDMLHVLAIRGALALQVTGAGVVLAEGNSIRFATAIDHMTAAIERTQEEAQQGPGVDAVRTGGSVRVSDLREDGQRWPPFTARAREHGVVAALSVPLRLGASRLGALDLYSTADRDWPDQHVAVAQALADAAAGYLSHANELERSRMMIAELRDTLAERIVIEQAKGMVAAYQQMTVDEASDVIQHYAASHGSSLRTVAAAIVNLGLRPLAEASQIPHRLHRLAVGERGREGWLSIARC